MITFSSLITKHGISGERLSLEDELVVTSDKFIVIVPRGFHTDLASTPRLVWVVYPPNGRYSYPAVVHDWLYKGGAIIDDIDGIAKRRTLSRAEADLMLFKLMRATGCRTYTCVIFYVAVRLFGWTHYRSSVAPRPDRADNRGNTAKRDG